MTDQDEMTAPQATSGQSEVTIVLSAEVLARLRKQVNFRTVGDVQAIVADALNSYLQLGRLRANGAEFFAGQDENGPLVRLHFPFDPGAPTPDTKSEG